MKRDYMTTRFIVAAATILMTTAVAGFAADPEAAKPEAKPAASTEVKPPAPPEAKTGKGETVGADESFVIGLKIPFTSPLFSDVVIATVNDEKISIRDLNGALATLHNSLTEEKSSPAKKSFAEPLQRLINVKLIIQEARNIGLDQEPELKAEVDGFANKVLRDLLMKKLVKDVKADPKDVEKLYQELIKEWKISAVVFKKEDEAKKLLAGIKSGKSFDELIAKPIKDGLAEKGKEEGFLHRNSIDPKMLETLATLRPGSVSPVIQLVNGFLVFKLVEQRSTENPELRQMAAQTMLKAARLKALNDNKSIFLKKYAKQNTQLIKKIDFEAKTPGFQKMAADKRVLVTFKGETNITVADLAAAIEEKFFHGVALAIKDKKINKEKLKLLDDMMTKKVFRRAALDAELDKTEEYTTQVADAANSQVFNAFVKKAIIPDILLKDQDLKKYYTEHIAEFTFPEMLQIDGIAFKTKADAQAALDKLRQGMDFKWLTNNASGLVDKEAPDLLKFDEELLLLKALPEGVQKVVDGAHAGDYKMYASPEGYFYDLYVLKVVPPRAQTFEEVRNDIFTKLFPQKLNDALEEWAKKLRTASNVKIYLDMH
jgi:parvulin-like peptidyl-prolyl isomerase